MGVGDIEKVNWNSRVLKEIKEYFAEEGLSAGQIIEKYFVIHKSNRLTEKLKELADAKLHVAQLEHDVTQIRAKRGTNNTICDTIFRNLCKNPKFDIENLDENDRERIRAVLHKKDVPMTVDDFVLTYRNNGGP